MKATLMNEQINMFQNDSLEYKLTNIFLKISHKLEYPTNIFSISKHFSTKGKNIGNLISTVVEINEESFPYDVNKKISKTTPAFLIIPNASMHEIRVAEEIYQNIPFPSSGIIKKTATSDFRYVYILFSLDDSNIFSYIENILECALQNYTSSNTFGCCSRYAECSIQKMYPYK